MPLLIWVFHCRSALAAGAWLRAMTGNKKSIRATARNDRVGDKVLWVRIKSYVLNSLIESQRGNSHVCEELRSQQNLNL